MADKKTKEELLAEYKALKEEGRKKGWEEPEQSVAGQVLEEAGNVAKGGLKALDYQRAALQRLLLEGAKAAGGKDLLTEEEKGALDPRNLQLAPGYGDILERQFGDFPGSQTLGFGLDIALDPATYESMGLAQLKKIPGVVQKLREMSAGSALAKIGEKLYRSPFRRGDTEIAERIGPETKKFSDIVLERGWTGKREKIHAKMNDYLDALIEQQKSILNDAGEDGLKINMSAAMADARAYADELIQRGNSKDANAILKKINELESVSMGSTPPMAPKMALPRKPEAPSSADVYLRPEVVEKYNKDLAKYQDDLGMYKAAQKKFQKEASEYIPLSTPSQASGMKTELWKDIPKDAFGKPVISESDVAGRLKIGGGLAQELEKMPVYGKQLAEVNKEMRPIFTAAPKEKLVLRQESNVPLVTGLDRNIAPLVLSLGDQGVTDFGKWALAKKIADQALFGSYLPTKVGKATMRFGKSGLTTPVLKAGFLQAQPVSPWTLLPEEEK